jgi:two-component SAPR family response regulator
MITLKKSVLYIIVFLIFLISQGSFIGGLRFQGNDHQIDQRTTYNVFDNKSVAFEKSFDIEFNLSLYPDMQMGYIVRIKNRNNDKVYNLFYAETDSNALFRFNAEGRSSLITAIMDKEELFSKHWFKMNISFDLDNKSLKLTIDDQTFETGNIELPDKYNPLIVFGKSDHMIDVPSFAIRNLSIGNNREFFFPLHEHKGNTVHNISGIPVGKVSNPQWLINDAYHWKPRASFKSESVAGGNYNPNKNEVYFFNKDSLYIYDVRTEETKEIVFDNTCPIDLTLGTNFIDVNQNKLYAYEVYYEAKDDKTTVASLDLNNYQWTTESNDQMPSQLHHHGSFFDPEEQIYTIFGGFGDMHYSKNFISYNLNQQEWQILDEFDGDFLSPRYFSSVGYSKKENTVYIFGGMGNESGEQIVGRKYFYDLYEVDFDTKQISKLWEIPWNKENVVPVRGMEIVGDSAFYTLCYPEHFSKSFLKLYRFSIKDGSYEILGDSIPINSDRISTNANLYYDNSHLYALIEESDNDISSVLKVYSLIFPPITAQELERYYIIWKRHRLRNIDNQANSAKTESSDIIRKRKTKPNSIYMFGDFTVLDRNKKDITYMFSTRLKQTFCIILQYSIGSGAGITSQQFSHIIWPDKTPEKVKNSRGVTINHLRKVLSELDGIQLIFDKVCFKIDQTEEFYCDYAQCMEILSSNELENRREEFVEILNRGTFLKHSEHPLFDTFKETTEQTLLPILLLEIEKSYVKRSFQATIDLCEAVFNIDSLNETAIVFQIKAMQKFKMTQKAKIRYQTFLMEYKKSMGVSYPGTGYSGFST